MDVFNKIKSTLTSTVSEIAAALPGNPLLREYDIGDQVASAGPDYLWKIYEGTKKSTKAAVSIFVLEKRQVDQYPRGSRELILEAVRKGVIQLTKLRHPRILTVEHAVEESRDSLVFCTEPVFASLGNVLGNKQNIAEIPTPLRSFHLHDVEIKYGILQISEGLSFLHSSAKMLHGNLCPESIIINKQGVWKLAGFDFCLHNVNQTGEAKFTCRDWDTTLASAAQPNCKYLAPEIILEKRCDFCSDLFSLGALLYSIYYSGKPLIECTHTDVYRVMSRSVDKLRNLSSYELDKVPNEVVEHERMLIHPDSSIRPDADQMEKLPYFEDIGVVTLQYLDNILQRDNLQKSQFFKGLAQVLPKLPKRVIIQRILPSLCAEFANSDMLPFVLPNVLAIAEDCDEKEFRTLVFPALLPIFKVQSPIQVLLIFLQKMDLLLKKTSKEMAQAHLLPMICNALAAPSIQVQELCLSIIPTFARLLDMPSMKNSIIPKIKKLIWEGGTVSVRINGLVCTGKLLPMLDKWFIYDQIFPILFHIKSREPGILMALLGVFQTTYSHKKLGITKDILATKVIPYLLPMTVENNLNLQQFTTFITVIKEMLQRVENDQKSKLEQLSQMKVVESTEAFNKLTRNEQQTNMSNGAKTELASNGSFLKSQNTEMTRQHLTLEEKQRLAKTKEQEYRMKQQGELKPIQSYKQQNTISNTKPKDLTSTLKQNNRSMINSSKTNNVMSSASTMNNMSMGSARSTSMNKTSIHSAPMIPQQPSSDRPSYMSNSLSQPGLSSYGGSMAPIMPQSSSVIGNSGLPIQSWNTGSSSGNFGNGMGQKSSLDNLLSMPSYAQSQPMQNMQSHIRPQYGIQRPVSHMQPAMGFPAPVQQNAFDIGNPFATPSPLAQGSSSQPSGANLSKQDLLDFLG
uniref:SCY1-like protein 2 isoform X1 n=1 Tax=Styela clava TaxID=7725 RepID=UPI0019394FAD|nr:SCY1-like protein 2 isoform X1 [Styela clava]XP_039251442.1 SCY1-like protein 2 isoform X1 [Styela clava]